jgi:purine-nucleoside phosphorylase
VSTGYDRLVDASEWLKRETAVTPEVAVVLGSGLGSFSEELTDPIAVEYERVPNWPASRVIGHAGRLVMGTMAGRRVAALSGRVHFYEGHQLASVVFAVRVMGLLGARVLILTNAAGGINTAFPQGVLMVIDDHINLMGSNPLVGENDDRLGPRFPDMSEVYSKRLRALADEVARARGLTIAHGMYVALLGPSYETPAEIRYLRGIGADAVGMSTVPEAIAARHMGLEVLGISCISNMAAGILPQPLNHAEVMDTTARVRGQFVALLKGVIERV